MHCTVSSLENGSLVIAPENPLTSVVSSEIRFFGSSKFSVEYVAPVSTRNSTGRVFTSKVSKGSALTLLRSFRGLSQYHSLSPPVDKGYCECGRGAFSTLGAMCGLWPLPRDGLCWAPSSGCRQSRTKCPGRPQRKHPS